MEKVEKNKSFKAAASWAFSSPSLDIHKKGLSVNFMCPCEQEVKFDCNLSALKCTKWNMSVCQVSCRYSTRAGCRPEGHFYLRLYFWLEPHFRFKLITFLPVSKIDMLTNPRRPWLPACFHGSRCHISLALITNDMIRFKSQINVLWLEGFAPSGWLVSKHLLCYYIWFEVISLLLWFVQIIC